jgi:hypothetical protein
MEWVLIAAAAAIAVVLFAPLRLRAGLNGDGRTRWFAEAAALGGLVRVGLGGEGRYWACGRWRGVLAPSAKTRRAAAASPAERGGALARKWGVLSGDERRALLRMLADVWSAVDIAVQGNIRYGFADPAVTAWGHALYCAARGSGKLAGLEAEADFADAGWSGQAAAVLTLRPALVLLPVARFFCGLYCRRIIEKWTGGRRKWQVQV